MNNFVALLRGINVGARTKIVMTELRALAEELGLAEVLTYIQSGNLIFSASDRAALLEEGLEAAIGARFNLAIPVMVRSASLWPAYVAENPFPEAAQAEPNRLMLMLSKLPPLPDAEAAIQERARDGEHVKLVGDALWVHFPGGSGTSKLSPSLIDRLVGSPVTARNWRTVLKLQQMLAA
ncbi:MAG TPA: DUF1697 domain-containing protein [Allosphingosinicella sp.]|nr:DUF1697 domain-containing protein [Allosphingosinicella sp.]